MKFKLKPSEIELARKTWVPIEKAGYYQLGFNLTTRILIDHKEIKALCRRYYQPNVELMIGEETCNIEQSPIHIFKENGYKIFESVKIALDCIEDFTSVASGLNDIGYSLYNFGTQIEHIDIVVEALLSTLQAVLQDEYTKKCKAIWSKILEIIALEIKIGLSNAENKL